MTTNNKWNGSDCWQEIYNELQEQNRIDYEWDMKSLKEWESDDTMLRELEAQNEWERKQEREQAKRIIEEWESDNSLLDTLG